MKKLHTYTLLVLLFVGVACGASEGTSNGDAAEQAGGTEMADQGYRRFQVKSGIVEYEIGGARKGTEVVYFDTWGLREAKYTKAEMSIMGITQKENSLTITDGEWIYAINLDTRTGTKTKNPLLKEITEGAGTKDLLEIGERMMKGMGGVKIGSEEVIGKMCDVWEVKNMGAKTWVWKGITLKTRTNMAGMQITSTATKIDEGASVPEDKFAIPSDVTITEGPDVQDLLKQMKQGNQ